MAKQKWDWIALKKEFFESTGETLVDFVRRKTGGKALYLTKTGQTKLIWQWAKNTQWWVKERKQFWSSITKNPEKFIDEVLQEQLNKELADWFKQFTQAFVESLKAKSKEIMEKIEQWKPIKMYDIMRMKEILWVRVEPAQEQQTNVWQSIEIKLTAVNPFMLWWEEKKDRKQK